MERWTRILVLSAALVAPALNTACPAASPGADEAVILAPGKPSDVADLRGTGIDRVQAVPNTGATDVAPALRSLRQHSTVCIGKGDFHLRATVLLEDIGGRGAGVVFDGGVIALDDPEWGAVLNGRLFGGGRFPFEVERPASARPGAPISLEIERLDGTLVVRLNDFEMGRIGMKGFALGRIGFDLGGGAMRVLDCTVEGDHATQARPLAVFTGADGDIDEYRDPAAASDGSNAIIMSVSVTTADDGSTATALHARRLRSGGVLSDPHRIDLGDVQPDLVVLGHREGDARPWKLLVQPVAARRLVDALVAYDSADGVTYERRGPVASNDAPIQLFPGAMLRTEGGALRAAATRLVGGTPRACAVALDMNGGWRISDLSEGAGCEPILLPDGSALVRLPKSGVRELARGGNRVESAGFEGAATAGAVLPGPGGAFGIAQAETGFPYPLRELTTADSGVSWTAGGTLWGGAAGHAIAVTLDGAPLIVFEGGDKARREHILVLRLRAGAAATTPTTTTPAVQAAVEGAVDPVGTPVTSPTAPRP